MKTELLAVFEGDQIAPGFDRVRVIDNKVPQDSFSIHFLKVQYESDDTENVNFVKIPYVSASINEEDRLAFVSLMAKLPYPYLDMIKKDLLPSGSVFFPNEGLDYKRFMSALDKDFQHKEVQFLLIFIMLIQQFSYPEWLADAVMEKEQEVLAEFENIYSMFNKASAQPSVPVSWRQFSKLLLALFSRIEVENVWDNSLMSPAHFDFVNLVETWLLSGDLSLTFRESIQNGFSLEKVNTSLSNEDNFLVVSQCADLMVQDIFKTTSFERIVYDDVFELLNDEEFQTTWGRMLDLTAFEALSSWNKIISAREGNALRSQGKEAVNAWANDEKIAIPFLHDGSRLKNTLSEHSEELITSFREDWSASHPELLSVLSDWSDHCSEGAYVPWYLYKEVHTS